MWIFIIFLTFSGMCFGIGNSLLTEQQREFVSSQISSIWRNPGVILHWFNGWVTAKVSKYFVEIESNSYTVHYPYGVRWYRIRVPRVVGPSSHVTKITADGEDVTIRIRELMGPSNNFHNQPVSSESLGYKSITFEYALEDSKTFTDDDTIVI
jgi:hypothetical protein